MQVETPQAGLRIHIAAVVIGEAVRSASEAGFFLTAVTAAANWLPVPDVTVRTLLWALEAFTGGHCLRYSWATTGEAGCHTALQPTHIGAALLRCQTVLVPGALTLTGALGVHPQVGAELVGAHARVASRLWQQVGLRGQMDEPEDKEQRQEWLWSRHGDHRARGWECVATSHSWSQDSLQASTL